MIKSTLAALCLAMPLVVMAAEPAPADAAKKQRSEQQTHAAQQRGADMARCRKEVEDQGLKGVDYRVAVGKCVASASAGAVN